MWRNIITAIRSQAARIWDTVRRTAQATATNTTTDSLDVEGPIGVYRSVYFVSIAVVILAGLYIGRLFTYASFDFLWIEWNVGYIVWAVELAVLVHFIQTTSPQLFTGVLVLSVPTIVASGYPILVIPGLHKLVTFSRASVEMELPDEPEKIFRKEDVEAVPDKMVPPIRITFANADQNDPAVDKTDPLQRRTTNEVSLFTRFRIRKFWDFYVRIQSLDEARRQLTDMGVGVLQEKLTTLTVGQTLAQLVPINSLLDDLVRERTERWGIEIIDYRIKLIGLSHTLNSAIQKIAESEAERTSKVIDANAEEQKRTKEGQGTANAVKAEILGRAEGLETMATKLGIAGKEVLGAETARAIGQGPSNTFIFGAVGITELAGLGVALAAKMTDKPGGAVAT
ncbi:hypothetical protein A2949_02640 [Candidatus Adlerbacteria bacterium RIFCSPLOWO2_01_FULL_54_21b]|uniref:Band 7 domain-containing protein n=1 Tax=Candidatus Adlerbacteria bacterium RIFCSPLOWO2_01_FULL_54_21b TaxID=1797245 RepID=A0A1F4XXU2_9BACT|nr:MAG: hypothetical protein A2949_02640 [Candidatus Adlerbacteria bacterium RIFCSPLOWO2_01_FULL_54_21b]